MVVGPFVQALLTNATPIDGCELRIAANLVSAAVEGGAALNLHKVQQSMSGLIRSRPSSVSCESEKGRYASRSWQV
jgi:hypothetical protein